MSAPDRVGLEPWHLPALVVADGLALAAGFSSAAARGSHPPILGVGAAVVVTLLAIVGLRSFSLRLVARVLLVLSAALLVRYGLLDGSISTHGQAILAWTVGAVGVLVVTDRIGSPDRIAAPGRPAVRAADPVGDHEDPHRTHRPGQDLSLIHI